MLLLSMKNILKGHFLIISGVIPNLLENTDN